MQYFKLLCMAPLLPQLCITICTTVRKLFDISLVVELLIYSKKCFLIQQNKNYSSICKSIFITSPIRFNIALTNVDARLRQHCINVVPTLCNVVSTLFQRRALTLYQRSATLKIRRRILFHFQRRINVISTLINNIETTLIRRSDLGWGKLSKREVQMKEQVSVADVRRLRLDVLKNFVNFTGKQLCWSLLLIKLQA